MPESGSTASTHAAPPAASQPTRQAAFWSVLSEQPATDAGAPTGQPDFFVDLNLDQVLDALTGGRGQYRLEPFFYAPLPEVGAVASRHEVLRDLEKPGVREAISAFAQEMERMRGHLEPIEALHYVLQKQSWFLDAVELYSEAVRSLAGGLGAAK